MKKKKVIIALILSVILILFFVCFKFYYKVENNVELNSIEEFVYEQMVDTSVEQLFTEKTFELGEVDISSDLVDYISTSDYMYKKATLDTSNVNENVAGDYTIICSVEDVDYVYTIHIVDTISPVFSITTNENLFGTFNTYNINDFIEEVNITDLSPVNDMQVISCVDDMGNEYEIIDNEFNFEIPGIYTFSFEVSDVFDNKSNTSLSIEVLESPHFVLLYDRQYKLNSRFSLLNFVFAFDKDENDITNAITILDDGGYDVTIAGDYNITYSITDDNGLTRNETITISVGDFEKNVFGFDNTPENLKLIVDSGYFKYEPLVDNTSTDIAFEYTQYACFGLKDSDGAGPECFIYKITENYVYILTCAHCKVESRNYNHLVDFEDNIITYDISQATITKCSFADLRIVKIPISTFDLSNLLSYKEVLVDWDIYDSMHVNDKILLNTQAFGCDGFDTLKDRLKVGTIKNFYTQFPNIWKEYLLVTNTHISITGASGSATFNINGYFLGINKGWIRQNGETMTAVVPLQNVKSFIDTIEFE